MSYGQRYKDGDLPKEIFIVSNGNQYKVYSKLSTARGLVTMNNKYYRTGVWKIYKVVVDGLEEVS